MTNEELDESLRKAGYLPFKAGPPVGEGCVSGCKPYSDGWSHPASCPRVAHMQALASAAGEHQRQHTIERSSGNYSRFLLWCAIFATNLRFENPKFVDVFYRILFFMAGMTALYFFNVWLKAKHSPRCAQKGPSGA